MRPIGASELPEPAIQTTLPAHSPHAGPARVRISVHVRNNGTRRTLAPTGTLTLGAQVIPLSLPGGDASPRRGRPSTRSPSTSPNPALWSPAPPEPL